MLQRPILIASLASIFAFLGGMPDCAWAGKAPMRPQAPLKPSQEREDYQECLTAVIKKYKSGDGPQRKLRIQNGIASCRERYPAVSLMIDCKKEMIAAYRDSHSDLKAALTQCRDEYVKYTFNPKQLVPFVLKEEQIFFAGAGLNRTLAARYKETAAGDDSIYLGDNFGNFSCSPLKAAMQNPAEAEHLLFGNELFLYTPLRHAKKETFLKSLGFTLGKQDSVFLHSELGELHYNVKSTEVTNYFPSSYCYFNRKLGDSFEGIKIYYLLDRPSSAVSPYFGVAFYTEKAAISSQQLAKQIQATLGQTYKVSEPKPGVFLISQSMPEAFDAEGDPKNICQSGQIPPYMALVHSREGSSLAAYSLLANTANLCRFGDRVTSRLLKRGKSSPPKGH